MDGGLTLRDLIGSPDSSRIPTTIPCLADFWGVVDQFDAALAPNRALANAYVNVLLSLISSVCAHTRGENGEHQAAELLYLCKAIMEKDTTRDDHPFATKAYQLISSNPLPSNMTVKERLKTLYIRLTDEYYPEAALAMENAIKENCAQDLDERYVALYAAVCSATKNKEIIAKLHLVFIDTFMTPSPFDMFRSGYRQAVAEFIGNDVSFFEELTC